jgi:hypothetical protein
MKVKKLLGSALAILVGVSLTLRCAAGQNPAEQPRTEPVSPVVATREGQLTAMRAEKLGHITPYRQGRLERGLVWVEQTGIPLLSISIAGFQPRIGGLPTGAGFALGTNYLLPDPKHRFPDLAGTAAWSVRGYQDYSLRFGKLDRGEPGAFAFTDFGYRNFPQEDFFGLGPDSRVVNRTDYLFEQASYEGAAGIRITPWLMTSVSGGLLQVNTSRGTDERYPDTHQLFSEPTAPGLASQPNFVRLSYDITADYRDRPGNTHKGGLIGLAFSSYRDRESGRYSFNTAAVDARHFLPLGSTVRTLALRFYASFAQPDSGSTVPFYFLQTLGGGDALRGYREYRFRDRNILYMSGEYRWEPARAIEIALFYDAGNVFEERSDVGFDGLRKSAGSGVRFKTPGNVVLRIDAARSSEGTRLYFKFGPSF